MNLINRIKSLFIKSDRIKYTYQGNTYFLDFTPTDYKYNTRDFFEYAYNAFGKNPHVYAVTSKIAKNLSQMQRAWFDDYEGNNLSAESKDLQVINNKLANPDILTHRSDFLELICLQLLVHGNAIIYPDYPIGFNTFDSVRLRIARMQDVTINTSNGDMTGTPISYTIANEYSKTYPASEVLHIAIPNNIENSYVGLPPLYAGQLSYEASNNNLEAQAQIHNNRGVSGILSPKDANIPMLPGEQVEMQKDWNRRTTGIEKFGSVHVTNQAMSYTPIGMNPSDLRLIESDLEHLRSICRIYGVSSALFNDKAGSTYNNVSEAKKDYYNDVLYPLSRKIDLSLSKYLTKMLGISGKYWQVNRDKIQFLAEVKTDLSEKIIKEVQAGILPKDSALEMLYPEIYADISQQQANNSNNANPSSEDKNAEAQANLRGSVGGVQGILSLQNSVSQGITSYDSAISVLVEIYGFELNVAINILGSIKTQPDE